MTSPYAQLFRVRGGWEFSAAGFFARLPLSMAAVAVLLMIVDLDGSYFIGGAVVATWTLVGAIAAPKIGSLTDRFGQRRVLVPQITVNVLAVVVLIALADAGAPTWTLFVASGVAGAATPVIGSIVRARWSYLLPGSPLLRTAFSWESVVDEFVFVVGPPLAAFAAAQLSGSAAVALTAFVGAVGTLALIAQRRTEPPPSRADTHTGDWVVRYPGMPAVMAVMAALGLLFAGVEVTVIAAANESGHTGAAGIVLALWSVSSMVTGLVVGGLRRAPDLYLQLLIGSCLMVVLLLPLVASPGLVATGVILLIAGIAVSPTLIAGFALTERIVPSTHLNEALNWVSTALSVGFALGTPSSGWLVDHFDVGAGYWVGIVAGAGAVIATILGRRGLTSRTRPV